MCNLATIWLPVAAFDMDSFAIRYFSSKATKKDTCGNMLEEKGDLRLQGTRQTREEKSFSTWCCAGALGRVCLSFGWRVCSAVRVHLSGCAYHLADVCAVLCGCTWAGVLIIWLTCVQCCAGALERVCLSFGWRVCSAVRVHLSGRAYH